MKSQGSTRCSALSGKNRVSTCLVSVQLALCTTRCGTHLSLDHAAEGDKFLGGKLISLVIFQLFFFLFSSSPRVVMRNVYVFQFSSKPRVMRD